MKKFTAILCAVFVCFFITACSGESNTAVSIKNAHMTTNLDSQGKPTDTVTTYSTSAQKLIVSAELKNAKANTLVKYVWTYVTANEEIVTNKVSYAEAGDKNLQNYLAISDFTTLSKWPEGDYKVEMYLNDDKTATAIVAFVVKENSSAVSTQSTSSTQSSGAYVLNAHMTTDLTSAGGPIDTVTSYKPAAAQLIASAELYSAPKNTNIKFTLTYTTSNILVGTYSLDSGDSYTQSRYIYCYFIQDKVWPTGDYQMDIYLGGQTTPAKTITFTVKE